MIGHKFPEETEPQMVDLHPLMAEMLSIASYLAWTWYHDDLIITAIWNPNHPGPTHRVKERYHRFVDCRLLQNGGQSGSERLRQTMNEAYPYARMPNGDLDPSRVHLETIPALDHEPGISTADHFHFQIAPFWLNALGVS